MKKREFERIFSIVTKVSLTMILFSALCGLGMAIRVRFGEADPVMGVYIRLYFEYILNSTALYMAAAFGALMYSMNGTEQN